MKKIIIALLLQMLFSELCIAQQQEQLAINSIVPTIEVKTFDNHATTLEELRGGKILVLEWFNPACPFVMKHYRDGGLQKVQSKYRNKGVVWVLVSSSYNKDSGYITEKAYNDFKQKFNPAVDAGLFDPDGVVGKTLGAKTSRHVVIIIPNKDKKPIIGFSGAMDNNADPFAPVENTKNYVADALEDTLSGKKIRNTSPQPYGCPVKYDPNKK